MLKFRILTMESKGIVIPKKRIKEISFICRAEEDSYVKVVKTNGAIFRMPISEVRIDGKLIEERFMSLLN